MSRLVRRAMIVGTGLIGGSVGMALRARGWHVSGTDAPAGVAARAVELGALTPRATTATADLVVVATPVHAAGGVIERDPGLRRSGTPRPSSPTSAA